MRHIIIFIVFTLLISSCYKEVKIDFPKQEILPVVNSIFQTDSIISIRLNELQPIIENGPTEITDAIVTLYEDGLEKEVLDFLDDSFQSHLVAKPNKEYKIVVEVSEFETVTAEEKLADFPIVISASFQDSLYIGDEGDLFSQATIVIENPPGNDYFELDMFLKNINAETNSEDPDFYDFSKSTLFYDPVLNDPVIQNEGLLSYFATEIIFSDELMNEGTHTLRINYRPFTPNFYTEETASSIVQIMKFRKVSKNYYQYKKTLTQHIETQFGDIWDGVGQPLPVFNNIENGYGIFAGFSQITDTIQKQ